MGEYCPPAGSLRALDYKGKAGKKMLGAKHTGVADDGKDLGKNAKNIIGGTKRTNKMLSPGPGVRKHA